VTLIRSDFDHGWEWRTAQNKNANAYTNDISQGVPIAIVYNFFVARFVAGFTMGAIK
jgi:hypothetical protein